MSGLVIGVDSSTQSVKVVLRDVDTGDLIGEARRSHPAGTQVDPRAWWSALSGALDSLTSTLRAAGRPLLGMGVAAQQHGLVMLGERGRVTRAALLWNDTRAAAAADALVVDAGGPTEWARRCGSVPVAAFTVAKARWVAEHDPNALAATRGLCLPHDWLTACLALPTLVADENPQIGTPVTDRGDASGTGYFDPVSGEYDRELLALAVGDRAWDLDLPRVIEPAGRAGVIVGTDLADGLLAGATLSAGTGDNMAAALGTGARTGDVVISLGTSGTAYAVSGSPTTDPTGAVAGFADATGGFLPLVCTLNAARVLDATAALLRMDQAELAAAALSAPAGAGGCVLLPYLDGERTPNLPDATGTLTGLTRQTLVPEMIARAAVEGMLCGLADAVDALVEQGVRVERILLIGGAAASPAVQQVARTVVSVPLIIPPAGEYVADGAARQAVWAVTGVIPPAEWGAVGKAVTLDPAPVGRVREQYAHARDSLYPR